MGYAARGDAWIPIEDWVEFVRKYMPTVHEAELSLGPPIVRDGEVSVPWAVNTECHPMDEANPPEWLKKKSC
jgi:hypothetical protein